MLRLAIHFLVAFRYETNIIQYFLPRYIYCRQFHGGVWILQVAVLANHQNGRDTHIRQMQVFGPRVDLVKSLGYEVGFTTPEVSMYATVR